MIQSMELMRFPRFQRLKKVTGKMSSGRQTCNNIHRPHDCMASLIPMGYRQQRTEATR